MDNFDNRFSITPVINRPRSKFRMNKKHLTTFNVGDLVPIYNRMVYPGDTVNIKTNFVVRTTTPIKAPFDIAWIDTYFFFVPMRLVWEHTKEFFGENKLTAWEQPTDYEIPQIKAPTGGWKKGTIADHMGFPTKVENIVVNSLKFRAYALIYQEWFRDQNLQNGTMINLDDATQTGSNGNDIEKDLQLGGMCAKAGKFHDYFTSCLPSPQKGPDVRIPIGESAPVYGEGGRTNMVGIQGNNIFPTDLYVSTTNQNQVRATNNNFTEGTSPGLALAPKGEVSNVYADLSEATSALISSVRQAFAVQQLYEAFARGGTRYREIVKNTFGVSSSDARMQIPEYLGGKRVPLNINQVIQTSETTETSPQGNVAGYSQTVDSDESFTKSFDEHGYIIGLAVVRTNHTYQQGIAREDFLKNKLELFWPQMEGIGEQAILNKEIYATGTSQDNEVFGYQERFAELKSEYNTISGEFRSNADQSLDVWHYADDYESKPILGPEWIKETQTNMDRTLQVTSSVSDQIHADFYFECIYTRPMQLYSIPGLTRM